MAAQPETGQEKPLDLASVLAGEYEVLRPGLGYAGQETTDALFAKANAEPQPFSALCISGGGIRSATFALGVLQGLAERKLLGQFDYLSTVSGGGYIGGWLTAWSNRVGGLKNVIPRLKAGAKPAAPGEADPIGHLRDYNSYLTPKLGPMSADTWTLAATIVRNLVLNWMVLLPLLMAALMLPRFYLSGLTFPELAFGEAIFAGGKANYRIVELDGIGTSWPISLGLPLVCGLLFFIAQFNTLRYLPGACNVEHTRADYLGKVLLPLAGSVLAYIAFDSLYYLGTVNWTDRSSLGGLVLAVLVPCAAAWLATLAVGGTEARKRLVFGPLPIAIAMMAIGTAVAIWATVNFLTWSADPDAAMSWAQYATLAPPATLLGYVLGTVVFVGLSSRFLQDDDREWMSRNVGWMLLSCAGWLALCGIVLIAPKFAIEWESWAPKALIAAGALSAWASAFGSSLLAKHAPKDASNPGKAWGAAVLAVRAAPAIFILAVAIGLTIATNLLLCSALAPPGLQVLSVKGAAVPWSDHYAVLARSNFLLLAGLCSALLLLSWVAARYININTFSLHGMYRDRLVRAYLGASNPKRKANKFTGFASDDNFRMHELDPKLKPLHVLNLTLNLVEANRLAWQQRKAQPFTVTALHCGNFELGYRPSARYGADQGLSLGTAMTISGAAASPNMGFRSSPAFGFIMTLLNARLGAWLGNPGPAGEWSWRHASPRSAIRSLVREAFGLTSNQSRYVYLSDGGHFENLGLYEMVLRRCRRIVVIDAGCDPDFSCDDLGNALRKIRIDLRVPIAFDDDSMQHVRDGKRRCAVASVAYSAVDPGASDGWLIYIKPMRIGNEPPDVDSYGRAHPAFPHEGTGDQWFDESQTESYRMLGCASIEQICRGWAGEGIDNLADLSRHVEVVYLGKPDPAAAL